jgi:hypothetical protein
MKLPNLSPRRLPTLRGSRGATGSIISLIFWRWLGWRLEAEEHVRLRSRRKLS